MNAVLSDYYLKSSDRTSVTLKEDMEKSDERRARLFEQQIANERRQAAHNKFVVDSKKYLLNESLFHILKQSLPKDTDASLLKLGRSVIESFTEEEDCSALINNFKTKTQFLSELASIIESTHRQVIHGCGDQDDLFKMNCSDMRIFNDKIEGLDSLGLSKAIMSRVAKAEEQFVAANMKDKEAMEELATKTQEKIDKVQHKDADMETDIKQEHTNMYHQQVKSIMNRPKNILESIVVRLSESIIKEDATRAQFSKKGKIDMDKIIEMSEVMYTFLEMVNTLKIKDVTPAYIQEALASI